MLHVRPSSRRAAAVALGAAGILVFGWLLESVAGDWGLADLDWPILDWLASHRSGSLTAVAVALRTGSGPLIALGIAAVAGLAWGVSRRELMRPLLLVGAVLADVLLVAGVRLWVDRARPPVWFEAMGSSGMPAFPAGHASAVLTLLFAGLYLAHSRRSASRGTGPAALAAALVGLAVGACDLYLGMHWFTDVLASWAISALVLATVVWIDSLRLPEPGESARAVDTEVARSRSSAET
ncbi:phosphatase PAP2 family protein [Sinomonas cellulolyticus]|uniref:Phosphatase PAP2 family protein n=1 Tax=Sinomonas cellulolyticus TaxID=2801916 RepID=A0ABS1K348_9MICC|nr:MULTISPECIES: phosphatase PAP2 family protein [Sinomonas]MBL0705923.1 phosphatase PAP2 family protein [Sinomonas cellulolyticus]GHG42646.1 phosphatase PAP2 family protein [Sinomonas sp. KCTC 49339]